MEEYKTPASLLLDLQEDVSILNARMSVADEQRLSILEVVKEIRQELIETRKAMGALPVIQEKLLQIEPEIVKAREFRLRVEGGAIVAKGIWIVTGAAIILVIQKIMDFVSTIGHR